MLYWKVDSFFFCVLNLNYLVVVLDRELWSGIGIGKFKIGNFVLLW